MRTLESLNFDNSYARLPGNFYQRIAPSPLEDACLISINERVAKLLDLDPSSLDGDKLARYFGGHEQLPGGESLAMKYTGHQFGVYNPDLGDGRGLLLGEVVNRRGERWDLHLKGAGRTAFSRAGDGRAVLRSSIREYLAGEAMEGLNIPTTRGLCLVGSQEEAIREIIEPCATLVRVSRCHIRFGHFEHFYYQQQFADLKLLADYSIQRFFPECSESQNPYREMFAQIVSRTARLVACWQSYGFVHGVLNTDNVSILGETFDYGPYTFMDHYDPGYVSNHSDYQGRYAFNKQPEIMHWNLACLAQALLPLVEQEDLLALLNGFKEDFEQQELKLKRARLGLLSEQPDDLGFIADLEALLVKQKVDATRFYRHLTELGQPATGPESLLALGMEPAVLKQWLQRYEGRVEREGASPSVRRMQMRSVNPKYILRNYMVEEVIQAAHTGDYGPVNQLLELLRHPFDEQPDFDRYANQVPGWASTITLSCSS